MRTRYSFAPGRVFIGGLILIHDRGVGSARAPGPTTGRPVAIRSGPAPTRVSLFQRRPRSGDEPGEFAPSLPLRVHAGPHRMAPHTPGGDGGSFGSARGFSTFKRYPSHPQRAIPPPHSPKGVLDHLPPKPPTTGFLDAPRGKGPPTTETETPNRITGWCGETRGSGPPRIEMARAGSTPTKSGGGPVLIGGGFGDEPKVIAHFTTPPAPPHARARVRRNHGPCPKKGSFEAIDESIPRGFFPSQASQTKRFALSWPPFSGADPGGFLPPLWATPARCPGWGMKRGLPLAPAPPGGAPREREGPTRPRGRPVAGAFFPAWKNDGYPGPKGRGGALFPPGPPRGGAPKSPPPRGGADRPPGALWPPTRFSPGAKSHRGGKGTPRPQPTRQHLGGSPREVGGIGPGAGTGDPDMP